MDDYLNFETYLFLSPRKFFISVNTDTNKKIYEKGYTLDRDSNDLDLISLDHFLNENIFKVEKILKNFVKNINLVIDSSEFFSIKLSVKKNNYGQLIKYENLNYILNEARDQCSQSLQGNKIIHILIDNYLIDEKSYPFLPDNLKCNYLSLDTNFICLPYSFIENIETKVNKYQISINKILSMSYMKTLFPDANLDIAYRAKQITDGCNQNEVVLSVKKSKNIGFFERFFNYFS